MSLERNQILELDEFLTKLLRIKDSDFSKFLNADTKTVIKPFITQLQLFWSFASFTEVDEITINLHEKFLKFLLRICPSFNTKLKGMKSDNDDPLLRSVICPKRFIESLFDPDPLGLLIYLYCTWNPSEFLDIIRDELIPGSIIKIFYNTSNSSSNDNTKGFIKWIIMNSSYQGPIKSFEKESILRRFEYESDDDYFEDEEESHSEPIDPLQAILLSNYISSPAIFSRTAGTRKSPNRLALLKESKLSHEQVEGWAMMLERNPKKSNILQDFIIWRKNNDK